MAAVDFAKKLGFTRKPKKAKKLTSGVVWTIEKGRETMASNLKKWVEDGLQQKDGKGKVWTVTNKEGTTFSLHYLTKVINLDGHNFTHDTENAAVKEKCLAWVDGIIAGEVDDEIRRIYDDAKAYRQKIAAKKKTTK
jgi:hypothetical protein